jgi:rhodanese-related sulfurtransferase
MRQITATELRDLLAGPTAKPEMLDVREPWEWQLAHIDGAQHVPMGQVPVRAEGWDQAQPRVVICHHGMRSLQVVAFLERQGFTNLHNLQGGINAWSRQVDPRVPTY